MAANWFNSLQFTYLEPLINTSLMRSTPNIPVNDKRIINGWAMFDWANSSYALVIAVAIFPLYFNGVVAEEFEIWGIPMTNTALFSYSVTIAYVLIAASLPLLSGIADYGGRKMYFMKIFTTVGSLACIALFWFTSMKTLAVGVLGFIVAVIGFAGGQVFYNSYLPLIASEEKYDSVSARGFAFGYIGSVILLIANLYIMMNYEQFGLQSESVGARIAFVMVGLWWIGFAQITFNRLPKDVRNKSEERLLTKGYQEIRKVWHALKHQFDAKRFLISFFFYSAGVQTVLYLASTFAVDELQFASSDLIILILLLQLVAIVGAFLFARISTLVGNKLAIIIMLLIWIGVCVASYNVYQKASFYIIAGCVGLVMGGIQALSRSTYSKLIPQDTTDTASYFSFYDVLEKAAIVLGTFSFGFIDQMLGGMRNSILALIVYFVIGLLILLTVKVAPPGGKSKPSLGAA